MKLTKTLTLAAMLTLLAGNTYAAGSHSTPCYFDGKTFNVDSGCTLTVKSGGALNLNTGATENNQATKTSGGFTDVSGIVFSTALTGNPMIQNNYTDVVVSTSLTSAAMTTILASTAGKTIYPMDVKIMVSGTATTATALALECSDGTLIASWPIADLLHNVPIGTAIASSTQAQVTTGAGLTKCPASTAVMLSNVGTNIGVTTHVYTKATYTVQ
jgi:hypothetical protein